jgi:3-hydroxybutyryl-CoA dehydrogenase
MSDSVIFESVGVVGAGTMGHGIAQVCAMVGSKVTLYDIDGDAVDRGLSAIKANLDKGVVRGKLSQDLAESTLGNLSGTTEMSLLADNADLIVEAAPERLDLKQSIFLQAEQYAPESSVFATNTSSLSVAKIASVLGDPSRLIGTHFFNPVHIMKLLELVTHDGTRPEVLSRLQDYGALLGKEVITVRDFPGFASSRLGICLGMEAIRMVEQGVASVENIDRAMSVGYGHPMGPLKLTDLVGLDVRMHIGEYLAKELNNPSFEPPALMREMVASGKLGKKSGQGFYSW